MPRGGAPRAEFGGTRGGGAPRAAFTGGARGQEFRGPRVSGNFGGGRATELGAGANREARAGAAGGIARGAQIGRSLAEGGRNAPLSSRAYSRMQPAQRDRAMAGMNADNRAQSLARMNPEQRAEAMYKMTPQERSQTMARMSPGLRNSFLAPGSERATAQARTSNSGRMLAGAAGIAGLAAASRGARMNQIAPERGAMLNRSGQGELLNRNATARGGMPGRANIAADRVAAIPGGANPRMGGREFSQSPGANLAYRGFSNERPMAGSALTGRAGAIDPGGYIRTSGPYSSTVVTPAFAHQQFASYMPNYNAIAAANAANIVGNPAAWPWQLPAYSPGWFNGWGGGWNGPWSWPSNWYNNSGWGWPGWGGPNCYSWNWGYGGYGGIWNSLLSLLPWGVNSNYGWVPYLHYYNGYTMNGATYPQQYYATNGFTPTHYVFNVSTGQFWAPGVGYVDQLPLGYIAPITVAVQESVPMYTSGGQVEGYNMQTFDYNAFWNRQAQAYGFYDYRQQYHNLTFPWLPSWEGNYIES